MRSAIPWVLSRARIANSSSRNAVGLSSAFRTKLATTGCESYPERDATGAVPVSGEGCTAPSYGTKQH